MSNKEQGARLAMALALTMSVPETPRVIYQESNNKGQDWKGRGKRKKVMK